MRSGHLRESNYTEGTCEPITTTFGSIMGDMKRLHMMSSAVDNYVEEEL
jgi:hypothetical protein